MEIFFRRNITVYHMVHSQTPLVDANTYMPILNTVTKKEGEKKDLKFNKTEISFINFDTLVQHYQQSDIDIDIKF